MIQRRIVIAGRVQGVFFRKSTFEEARKYPSLKGYVRNQPNGTVEVLCAGGENEVQSLIAWCKKGPRLAKVTSIEITEEPFEKADRSELEKFHIAK